MTDQATENRDHYERSLMPQIRVSAKGAAERKPSLSRFTRGPS